MDRTALIGLWTGSVHDSNGWDMKITLSILQPLEVGETLGIFDIPLLPCSGTLRVVSFQAGRVELRAEKLLGECGPIDSAALELLSDGALLYTSRGEGWEREGVLERAADEQSVIQ